MLFGLFNASTSFQEYINKILAEKSHNFVVLYLNDILIYSKDPGKQHKKAVCWVIDQLQKYSLFASLKKCCFYQDKIQFFEFIVFVQGIQIEEKNIEAVII